MKLIQDKKTLSLIGLAGLVLIACTQKKPIISSDEAQVSSKEMIEPVSSSSSNRIEVSDQVAYSKNGFFRGIYIGNVFVDQKLIMNEDHDSWSSVSKAIYGNQEQARVLKQINQDLPKKGDWVYAPSFNDASSEQLPKPDETEFKVTEVSDEPYPKDAMRDSLPNDILLEQTAEDVKTLKICQSNAISVDNIYPDFPIGCAYEVVQGDTLGQIAQFFFGRASKWRDIYTLNQSIIGDNPNLIFPKQKLGL